jgi:hypothetical protein
MNTGKNKSKIPNPVRDSVLRISKKYGKEAIENLDSQTQ